jgi:hypothetical protein
VDRIEHERGGVVMQGRVPGRLIAQFSPWSVTTTPVAEAEEGSDGESPGDEEEGEEV